VTVLALDLGTKTGWALRSDSGHITSGVTNFSTKRIEGGGMRFLKFKRWLIEMKQADVHEIYFEEVRNHAGVNVAHAFVGFMAILASWCEHHEIPYQSIPVGTIKKHATGKGNASKQMMIKAAIDRGFNPIDDNEADAIVILFCVSG